MKKTITSSIAQTPFILEEDAFMALDAYLHSIKNHFAANTDKDEIVRDIEARVAEKLSDTNRAIITIADVERVITEMGSVHQFDETSSSETVAKTDGQRKKMYRDTDDSVIAGVASGLAQYLGVDTIIVRIAFVILGFCNGFGVLLYLILWMVIPEAKTASQKIEMRGDAVTLATLSSMMKEKLEEMNATTKKNGFRSILMIPIKLLRTLATGIQRILFPAIRILIGVMLMLGGITVAIGSSILLGILLLGVPVGFLPDGFPDMFHGTLFYLTIILGYLTVLTPSILIFFGGLGILQKKPVLSRIAVLSLIAITFVSGVAGGISGGRFLMIARESIHSSSVYEEQTMAISDLGPFTAVSASGMVRVTLIEGPLYEVAVSGRGYDVGNTAVSAIDGVLSVGEKDTADRCLFCSHRNVSVTITAPDITTITALDASRIQGDMTSDSPLSLTARDVGRIDMRITGTAVAATLTDAARIILSGSATTGTIIASDVSRFEGEAFVAQDVTVGTSDTATVTVAPVRSLSAKAIDASRIRYTTIPHTTAKEVKDVASVKQQEE